MPTAAGRRTKKERLAEYWPGLSPAQRDWQRFALGEIPDGADWDPETWNGMEAKRLVEDWFERIDR